MHSLKDTQFWLWYFLFIVPVVKNDLKLCVNHQFIAPSPYNQITQLIFITDIFRPKIKCTTLFGGTLCLSEVSRFLSTFDRSRNGCQVIKLGILGGLPGRRSLSPRLSPSRTPVFSCAHYFQAPATQVNTAYVANERIIFWSEKRGSCCGRGSFSLNGINTAVYLINENLWFSFDWS